MLAALSMLALATYVGACACYAQYCASQIIICSLVSLDVARAVDQVAPPPSCLLACCCSDNCLLSVCLRPSCHCFSTNVVQMSQFLPDCFHLSVATCFCAVTAVLPGLLPLGQLPVICVATILAGLLLLSTTVLIFRSMPQAMPLRGGWICI